MQMMSEDTAASKRHVFWILQRQRDMSLGRCSILTHHLHCPLSPDFSLWDLRKFSSMGGIFRYSRDMSLGCCSVRETYLLDAAVSSLIICIDPFSPDFNLWDLRKFSSMGGIFRSLGQVQSQCVRHSLHSLPGHRSQSSLCIGLGPGACRAFQPFLSPPLAILLFFGLCQTLFSELIPGLGEKFAHRPQQADGSSSSPFSRCQELQGQTLLR